MDKVKQHIIDQIYSDGITIGQIRKLCKFDNIEKVLTFLKNELSLDLLEISGNKIEDVNDDQLIHLIDVNLNEYPNITELINKLHDENGVSLNEIKQLTGWNNENLAENMNKYLDCNLTLILQEAVTDEFRIRLS